MQASHPTLSLRRQSGLLDLSRSSLYYRAVSKESDTYFANEIHALWLKRPFYGYRKIHAQLLREGYGINHKRVQRLMQQMSLCSMLPGPKTSQPRQQDPKWPNLLLGVRIERVHQVWATDITYVRIPQGFIYLVALIDVYSRYIVAYQVSITLEAEFCVSMTKTALVRGKPDILHSDQGGQFTCDDMKELLLHHEVAGSMTGKGRCSDNVYIERFWESLKYEDQYLKDYASVKEAKASIGEYVLFYNEERLHQHLHYQTPKEVYTKQNKIPIESFVYKERTKKKEVN